jgi:hypothetical protein
MQEQEQEHSHMSRHSVRHHPTWHVRAVSSAAQRQITFN